MMRAATAGLGMALIIGGGSLVIATHFEGPVILDGPFLTTLSSQIENEKARRRIVADEVFRGGIASGIGAGMFVFGLMLPPARKSVQRRVARKEAQA